MTESIIVGVVVGVVVAGIGAVISHYLRKREMEALWAKEEQKRKSDRRRELYERELRIVSDSVNAAVEVMLAKWFGCLHKGEGANRVVELIRQVYPMMWRAKFVTDSLGDQELMERYDELLERFIGWFDLLDLDTGEAIEGREKEAGELTAEMQLVASAVWRRIREILVEV